MTTAAYTYKHRQDRQVSLTKLGVVLVNFALWASLIAGLAMIAR